MGSHNTHFRVFISSIGGHAVDTGACRIASNEKYLFQGIVGGWGWLLFAVPAGRIIEANDPHFTRPKAGASGSKAELQKLALYQQACYTEARERLLFILAATASADDRIEASVVPVGNMFFVTTTLKRHKKITVQLGVLLVRDNLEETI